MKLYKAIKNGDEGVFKSPKVIGDLFGYKKVNTYFVDNSGFGDRGEPAMVISDFLSQVKQGCYYGITSVGQFQVYIGEFIKDKTSRKNKLAEMGCISRKKIANNTYELIKTTGERVIRLHNTDILRFTSDNRVILNTGGYDTMLTRARLNDFTPNNIRIYRNKGISYILKDNEKIEFLDNIEISL